MHGIHSKQHHAAAAQYAAQGFQRMSGLNSASLHHNEPMHKVRAKQWMPGRAGNTAGLRQQLRMRGA